MICIGELSVNAPGGTEQRAGLPFERVPRPGRMLDCLTSIGRGSEALTPLLPIRFQPRHERDEPRVIAKVVQLSVVREQRIAGEAVIRGVLEPLNRFRAFAEQRIRGRNVIGSVVKVAERSTKFDRPLNRGFRLRSSSGFRLDHCAYAVPDSAFIIG